MRETTGWRLWWLTGTTSDMWLFMISSRSPYQLYIYIYIYYIHILHIYITYILYIYICTYYWASQYMPYRLAQRMVMSWQSMDSMPPSPPLETAWSTTMVWSSLPSELDSIDCAFKLMHPGIGIKIQGTTCTMPRSKLVVGGTPTMVPVSTQRGCTPAAREGALVATVTSKSIIMELLGREQELGTVLRRPTAFLFPSTDPAIFRHVSIRRMPFFRSANQVQTVFHNSIRYTQLLDFWVHYSTLSEALAVKCGTVLRELNFSLFQANDLRKY